MTNEEYRKSLKGTKLEKLVEMYNKVFGVPAPSKFAKADYVAALFDKFCELRKKEGYVEPENAEKEAKRRRTELAFDQKAKIRQILFGLYDTAFFHGSQRMEKFPVDSSEGPLEQIVKIVEEE